MLDLKTYELYSKQNVQAVRTQNIEYELHQYNYTDIYCTQLYTFTVIVSSIVAYMCV